MIDRLRKIANHFKLSPATFADQIGISRPVVSHLFSERNKPSLEVVQKIGKAFPELNLEWLLYGQGEMLKSVAESGVIIQEPVIPTTAESKFESADSAETETETNTIYENEKKEVLMPEAKPKRVSRIVFFYSDDTFKEFKPDQSK